MVTPAGLGYGRFVPFPCFGSPNMTDLPEIPTDWPRFLDFVLDQLAGGLADSARREGRYGNGGAAEPDQTWRQALERTGERLAQWQARIEKAARAATEAEAALGTAEEDLAHWQER